MAMVKIDPAVAMEVARDMRDWAAQAEAAADQLRRASRYALVPVPSWGQVDAGVAKIRSSAADLEARAQLAVLIDAAKAGSWTAVPDGWITFDMDDESPAGVSARLGAEAADLAGKVGANVHDWSLPGGLDGRPDVAPGALQTAEQVSALLKAHQGDPAFVQAFFDRLGPAGTLAMQERFATLGQVLQGCPDGLGPNGAARNEAWQTQFASAVGSAYASYTSMPSFGVDQRRDLAAAVAADPAGGWEFSRLLDNGTYSAQFLAAMGERLMAVEDGHSYRWELPDDPAWAALTGGTKASDPFVALFTAMGRTPQGAATFFNPDNGGPKATARMAYFVQQRAYPDDMDAVCRALGAGAGVNHTAAAARDAQNQSAWIASGAVLYLNRRRGQVGKGGRDSIGHLLAAYIADVDQVARYHLTTATGPGLAPAGAGMPSGAALDGDSLRNVLAQVMQDDAGLRQVATAAGMLNSDRTAAGIAAWPTDPAHDGATLKDVAVANTKLLAYLSGTIAKGRSDDAAAAAASSAELVDVASAAIDLVPVGGKLASFVAGLAKDAGRDYATTALTGATAAAQQTNFNANFDGLRRAQWQVAAALAGAGQLPGMPTGYTDPADGQRHPYPWIVNGQIDLAKLDQTSRSGKDDRLIADWWDSVVTGQIEVSGTVDRFVPGLDGEWNTAHQYGLGEGQ